MTAWLETRKSVGVAVVVLSVSIATLAALLTKMPNLEESDRNALWDNIPPRSVASVVVIRDVLQKYADAHTLSVVAIICAAYVLIQAFAVPGTIFLTLLSGALFGRAWGFVLVALASTAGATTCFGLSWAIGRPIVQSLWPQRLAGFQAEVSRRRSEMFSYMVFLRVTPILPNSFISFASPVVGVPLPIFMAATLLGCAPNNLMAVNAGAHLGELQSLADLYDIKMVGLGVLVGVVAIVPIFWKRRSASVPEAATAAAAGAKHD